MVPGSEGEVSISSIVIALLAGMLFLVFVIGTLVLIHIRFYTRVPPEKALVIYGGSSGPQGISRILVSGGAFITPVLRSYGVIPLKTLTVEMRARDVPASDTSLHENLEVDMDLKYRIPKDQKMLERAAGSLLNKSEEELCGIVGTLVEKYLRKEAFKFRKNIIKEDPEILEGPILRSASREMADYGVRLEDLHISRIG
ncbi:MAG: hypothetical protein R6V01_08655 [Thermoplasmatota archaeon]